MRLPDDRTVATPGHAMPQASTLKFLYRCGATLALWGACSGAWASGKSAETYDLQPLAQPTVAEDMQRCLGAQASAGRMQEFLARALDDSAAGDTSRGAQLAAEQGSGVVLAAAGQWACVPLSREGFPVWPLESMHGLIVPVGVPAAATHAWRRNLLAQVARDGVGRGLIVYPGGEAEQVHVIAEQRQALQIKLSLRLLPAGSYKEQLYPAVLRHPGLTRLVTRSTSAGGGTPWRMAIPPHRLAKPVQDGFVVVEPTAQTSRFVFEGTQWLVGGEAGPVALRADGTVAAGGGETRTNTRGSKPLGHWRVRNGVLQLVMADGSHYALTLRDNPYMLTGVGRRANDEAPEDEGSEVQWPAQIHRHGTSETGTPPLQQAAGAGPRALRA